MKHTQQLLSLLSVFALSGLGAAAEPAAAESAPKPSRYSLELGFTGNLALNDITNDKEMEGVQVHTWGIDLTAVRKFNEHHALTLRFGYAEGSASNEGYVGQYLYEVEGKLRSFSLMPGYRYSHTIYGKLGAFAGVNVGIICHNAEDHERWEDQMWVDVKNYAIGLAYSAELGLTWQKGPHLSYFLAYQFSGSTARPKLEWHNEDATYSATMNEQAYHSIRCGLSYSF